LIDHRISVVREHTWGSDIVSVAVSHCAAEVFPDQFTVLVSYPVAPNKTREELHVFLIDDAATADKYADARDATMKMWHDLNLEDLSMLELVQQGRLSPAYDGGRLSPH